MHALFSDILIFQVIVLIVQDSEGSASVVYIGSISSNKGPSYRQEVGTGNFHYLLVLSQGRLWRKTSLSSFHSASVSFLTAAL